MKCRVIFGGAEGGGFSSDGELKFSDDGFTLEYVINGDDCFLAYSGGVLTQRRKGNVPLTLSFCAGRQTDCVLELNGSFGRTEVFTKKLDVKKYTYGVEINIRYTLGGESKALCISAQALN